MSCLKWHGGKHYMAQHIIDLMPAHMTYVEPYFGSGAVLFARDGEGASEIINDIDRTLTNFWRTLQDPVTFEAFRRKVEVTPFSKIEFRDADPNDPVGFFVRNRQSLAGRMNGFTGITQNRLSRGMNNDVSGWLSAVDGLPEVHARLRRVLILDSEDATDVIRRFNRPDVLLYLDPPYLHETRTSTDVYSHEMTVAQHVSLLDSCLDSKSKVMLSGYASDLYDEKLRTWRRLEFDLPNNASSSRNKQRKQEVLWLNY